MVRIMSLVLMVVAGLAAGGPEGRAQQHRNLEIGITQYPSTLHPLIESMLAKSYILGMTRRPITAYDQDWNLVCMLCTKLPTLENGLAEPEALPSGGKGIAVRYSLHPEATWGDGTPVTTEDVVFTWKVGRHPATGVAGLEGFQRIRDIEVIDEKTFIAHVDRITYTYNASGGFELLPAHIERSIFEANPREYRHRTAFDTDPTDPGLHFGPYRIAAVTPGASVVLERNPTWWGKEPAFDRVTVKVIENTAALEANLLSGSIDMIAGELGLSLDQALAFEQRHGDRFDIEYKPTLQYEHIDLNLANPRLEDPRVRRAMLHAIDREAINERLFAGRQPVAHTSVSPLDWVYLEDVRTYPYDPERAAELLDEAGWTGRSDGIRTNAEGKLLSFEFMTTAGHRIRELVQQVLQSQWREAGIQVKVRNEPARVFFGETVSKRKFTGLAMFAWLSAPESVPRTTLHSEEIPTEETNWSGQNYTGYDNPEMDRLIDAIEVELDREARRKLWAELQRLYAEDLPVLPLYWRASAFVLPKWLTGVRPTGHLGTTTLWIEEWGVEEP